MTDPQRQRTMIDISRGMIPVAVALIIIVFVASSSYAVGSLLSNVQRDASEFKSEIGLIKQDLAAIRKDMIAITTGWPATDKWSKSDQIKFCLGAERANANWHCPSIINDVP